MLAREREHTTTRATVYRLPCQGLGTGQPPRCQSIACWPAGLLGVRPPARDTIKGPSSAWSI
jgi:hypothetical protein